MKQNKAKGDIWNKLHCKRCNEITTDGFDLCGNCLALKHIEDFRKEPVIVGAKIINRPK